MSFIQWEDRYFHGIVPPEPVGAEYLDSMGSFKLSSCLTEYFREVVHPHVLAMQTKYPALFNNKMASITWRLKLRYPSGRLTDEEYDKKWNDIMSAPSFLSKIPRSPEWQGGTIQVPFRNGDKR